MYQSHGSPAGERRDGGEAEALENILVESANRTNAN